MFIWRSTFEAMEQEISQLKIDLLAAQTEYVSMREAYRKQRDEMHKLRVDTMMEVGLLLNQQVNPFSKEDIKRLLMLCHPDRHGGKESAKQMTQKLLQLRDKMP